MASKYWLKLYHEMLDDPKVARLSDTLYRRFIECLLLAGEVDDDGYLPPVDDILWRLRIDQSILTEDMNRLASVGLVEQKDNGLWFVSSFSRRQAPSDAAQRMKEMRKRKREERKKLETDTKLDTEKDIDIDTYRSVTSDVTDVTKSNGNLHDPVTDFITSLAKISKTPHWTKTEEDYTDAAMFLHGKDATQEQIEGFGEYWKMNGYYNDKPALKTIIDDWDKYTATAKKKENLFNQNGSLQI